MKVKITAPLAQGLDIKDKIYDVTDELLPGFVLRINPSGTKVFWLRYTLSNGKRDRISIGRFGILTVAQAREEAKKYLADVSKGIDPKAPKRVSQICTLNEFIEKEYSSWSESHHQHSKEQLQRICRMKEFLTLPINEVMPHLVEKWRSRRLKEGVSPNTLNRDVTALKAAISKAIEWGVISEHPLKILKPLKVDRSPKIRYLTEDEENQLRQALDNREKRINLERGSANKWRLQRGYELLPTLSQLAFADYLKPLILLSLNTGARQGELFRLQWDDIDFDRKSLALVMRGKRKSYTRYIPLNREALETLIAWRKMRPQTDKLVFPSKNGGQFDNIQTSWDSLRKDARIDNFRWHDMRHHFASRLVMNGVPLNTVRELLGHTSVEMTLRYAHLAPEQKEKAVATLDRENV